jgi:hypothetical protein
MPGLPAGWQGKGVNGALGEFHFHDPWEAIAPTSHHRGTK